MNDSGKLQRVSYFFGQVLGEDDFKTEQNYFIEKHRLHNRHLHGWGVVNGLEVSVDKGNVVHVSPGIAIDCAGTKFAALRSGTQRPAQGKRFLCCRRISRNRSRSRPNCSRYRRLYRTDA